MLTRNSMVLAAGTAQPFADLRGMLERARREPGRVGTGSTEALSSFLGQELARRAGLEMPDIQYRSGGQLMNDIVAGHLPVGWTSTASVTPHVQTGRIRVLATAGADPHALLPRRADPGGGRRPRHRAVRLGRAARPRRAARRRRRAPARPARAAPSPTRPSSSASRTLGIEPDLRPADALRAEMRREDAYWAAAARAGTLKAPG